MKTFELSGTKREELGTKFAKIVRKEGKVPSFMATASKSISR